MKLSGIDWGTSLQVLVNFLLRSGGLGMVSSMGVVWLHGTLHQNLACLLIISCSFH